MSPSRSGVPSAREKILADDGQRSIRCAEVGQAYRRCRRRSRMPSRASAIAGLSRSASVKLARAVFVERQREPRDGAGHADAERGIARFGGIGLAVGSEENIARGRRRCGLAIVDGDVLVALGEMDHHEAAAADIAGARIGHRQRKAGGDRGIDRIAALRRMSAPIRAASFSCATTMPCSAETAWIVPISRLAAYRRGAPARRQARRS